MKLNTRPKAAALAAAGAPAHPSQSENMLLLRRSVACALLWEDGLKFGAESLAARIQRLVPLCPWEFVASLAIEAREVHKLRHVPLLLLRELARHPGRYAAEPPLKELIPRVCTRADQLAELVALYWATNDGKKGLPAQVKKGLAAAFANFGSYALAKNDHQSAAVALRDVAFLAHPKHAKLGPYRADPDYKERQYKNARGTVVGSNGALMRHRGEALDLLCTNTLPTPDTWEVKLSAAKTREGRQAAWLELLAEAKLGGLAWLRNLRLMTEKDGLSQEIVLEYGRYLAKNTTSLQGIFPFQFMTAARLCPWAASALQPMLLAACEGLPRLPGKTVILVDVSGSMKAQLAQKGDATRMDAAVGVAMLAREVCEHASIWSFSDRLVAITDTTSEIHGFPLAEKIKNSQPHHSTAMREAVRELHFRSRDKESWARTIIVTDEQTTDGALGDGLGRGYVMNVATEVKSVAGSEKWFSISGWSPAVLSYIAQAEQL